MTNTPGSVTIHAVCGGTGAGKSTLALRLKKQEGAFLFAGDKWMSRLFYPDMTGAPEFDWIWERIGRVEDQIWDQVEQLAEMGIPSVLDLGLTTSEHRRKFADRAAKSGLLFRLHWIDLPVELRWQRVEQRNQQRGETFAIEVSRENFDFVEDMWEQPDDQELQQLNAKIYREPDL